mgnify:FL=1|jgi:hypothetical protein
MVEMGVNSVDRVWIVCGKITNEDAAEAYQSDAKVGDVEYQFSDGPPGERTFSADYVDLTEGIRDHAHCKIYWVGNETIVQTKGVQDHG